MLRDIEDLSYDEIAEITQVSLGTVKSRITRGRDALRKRLTEYAKEVGPELGLLEPDCRGSDFSRQTNGGHSMTCLQAKSMFSAYLDGAITGTQMLSLGRHMEDCASCEREYRSLRSTQQLLANMGRAKAPEDLSLKLRLAISREAARRRQPYFGNLMFRLENSLRGFMVPATAGLVATVAIFALLMGFITPVQADTSDVPLLISTKPELQQSGFGMTMGAITEDSLVIEAYVDANGRVQDYRIISSPGQAAGPPASGEEHADLHHLPPGHLDGNASSGTAVLSFSKISVKG